MPSSHVVGYLIVFVLLKAAASTMPEPISDKTHQPLSAAEGYNPAIVDPVNALQLTIANSS